METIKEVQNHFFLKHHIFNLRAEVSKFPYLLLAARRKNTSYEVILGRKQMECILSVFSSLIWQPCRIHYYLRYHNMYKYVYIYIFFDHSWGGG